LDWMLARFALNCSVAAFLYRGFFFAGLYWAGWAVSTALAPIRQLASKF
jgi:hypothetical protein